MEQVKIITNFCPNEVTASGTNEWLEKMAGKIIVKDRILNGDYDYLVIFYEPVPTVKVKSFENKDDDTINQWLASQKKEATERSGMFRVVQSTLSVSIEPGMSKTVTQIFYEEL